VRHFGEVRGWSVRRSDLRQLPREHRVCKDNVCRPPHRRPVPPPGLERRHRLQRQPRLHHRRQVRCWCLRRHGRGLHPDRQSLHGQRLLRDGRILPAAWPPPRPTARTAATATAAPAPAPRSAAPMTASPRPRISVSAALALAARPSPAPIRTMSAPRSARAPSAAVPSSATCSAGPI